jgi:hypothetical protein
VDEMNRLTALQDEIMDRGLDMFFTQPDTFGRLAEVRGLSDIDELPEPEDIVQEIKEIWEGL